MNRLARFAGFGRNQHEYGVAAEGPEASVPVERMDSEELREPIVAALRGVHDPEIPVNIYDLGLIYKVEISDEGDVSVDMTLTAPSCPVAEMMPLMVKDAIASVDGVGLINVELVWEPPWTPDCMTEEARLELGMM